MKIQAQTEEWAGLPGLAPPPPAKKTAKDRLRDCWRELDRRWRADPGKRAQVARVRAIWIHGWPRRGDGANVDLPEPEDADE